MKTIPTGIPDVLLLEPRVFTDARGFFLEWYNRRAFAPLGIPDTFVQDNHSRSTRGILRGLHYQIQQPQGKLVRVVAGEVYDVAVDLRRSSPTFGKCTGFVLSEKNRHIAWIPAGFAHGFLTLSDTADFLYKTTDYYAPEHERCIRWNDPQLAIAWPRDVRPVLSGKDEAGTAFKDAELFP